MRLIFFVYAMSQFSPAASPPVQPDFYMWLNAGGRSDGTLAVGLMAAQERYVSAEVNERSELVITTSTGQRIVLETYDDEYIAGRPVEFKQIAISDDSAAVGWIDYSPVCLGGRWDGDFRKTCSIQASKRANSL